MAVRDVYKKIEEIAEDDGSWLEEARYRKENRYWLRKSQRIAIRVLVTLRERGMQQKELAEQMGVSPQHISKIVKGKENLTLQTISKLEQILGITLFQIPDFPKRDEEPFSGEYQTKERVEMPELCEPDYEFSEETEINKRIKQKELENAGIAYY
ncbi:MAG TPA: helix-turn-helix transcriptional regulator [Balneolales bacterium]|nr:helix-turn-helix transcriptional regulator [Balneolales bacterium]